MPPKGYRRTGCSKFDQPRVHLARPHDPAAINHASLGHHPPSFHAISTQIAARQSHPTTSALIAILGVHFSRLAPRVDSLLDHLQRRSARLAITAA